MSISTTEGVIEFVEKSRFSLTEPATLDASRHETSRTNEAISSLLKSAGLPESLIELIILDTNIEEIIEGFAIDLERFERDNEADRRYDRMRN